MMRSLLLVAALLLVACGGSGSNDTDVFCERWEESLQQQAVVLGLDETDPNFSFELQRLTDINASLYETAPPEIQVAAQDLADLQAGATPEQLTELSATIDDLTATILGFVTGNCAT